MPHQAAQAGLVRVRVRVRVGVGVGVRVRVRVKVRRRRPALVAGTQQPNLSGARLARVSSRPAWDPVCSSGVRALCGVRQQDPSQDGHPEEHRRL